MGVTLTDLPDLSSDYPLSEQQIADFRRDGHILLRGVCSPTEIAAYREALNAAAYRYNTETRPMEERDTYGKAFLQIMNLWPKDAGARKYVFSRRFAKIAAELMGVDGIRLYHDQALYKEAGGGPTPWHQDQYYWPLDTSHTVTMWMPLVDVPVEMGALTFATGTHVGGRLNNIPISDESQDLFENYVRDNHLPIWNTPMKAGDATFHAGYTLHSAPGNQSDQTREVMTVIYMPDGINLLAELDNPNREMDLASWFPGARAGERAVSALNPLLYKK